MHRVCRCLRPAVPSCVAAVAGLFLVTALISNASAQRTRPPQSDPVPGEMAPSSLPEQPAFEAAQVARPSAPPQAAAAEQNPADTYAGGTSAAVMLGIPITTLSPGNIKPGARPKNPVEGQSQAIQRGMTYFNSFNCVGCHAPNGGGGMGPSLSNGYFIYGGESANIYLSIYQGRPNGMPAWGSMLPDNIIWEIVAYIRSISNEPSPSWGRTISRDAMREEQVPTEYVESTKPWDARQKFSFGQKPNRAK
jgi:cytochrome c oxidase cbb3-type subunit 3